MRHTDSKAGSMRQQLAVISPFQEHVRRWKNCSLCPLCAQRQYVVLSRGSIPCDVLFVGEAPGESEDSCGQPFKGPAGKELNRIIKDAMPRKWVDDSDPHAVMAEVMGDAPFKYRIAFTNLVACFPKEAKERGENEPEKGEILKCRPRLEEFIHLARPKLIVCVGALAEKYLETSWPAIRVSIVHPAAILRAKWAQKSSMKLEATVTLADALEELE